MQQFIRPEVNLTIPSTVELLEDLDYVGGGHERQSLHLMLPKQMSDKPLPLIIYIHGGAWSHGTKDLQVERLLPFVESGEYAAAAINYRFTDEGIWPMQMDDCIQALTYLSDVADEHSLDRSRFALWGSSSGAHLAAMLGLQNQLNLKCVINYCGPSHFVPVLEHEHLAEHGQADTPLGKLVGGAVWDFPDRVVELSPVCQVHDQSPPMLLVHGTADEAVPYSQSIDLQAAYKEVDCEAYLVTLKDFGHKFQHDALEALVKDFFDCYLYNRRVDLKDLELR